MTPLTKEAFLFIWEPAFGQQQASLEYAKYAIWLLYNYRFQRRTDYV